MNRRYFLRQSVVGGGAFLLANTGLISFVAKAFARPEVSFQRVIENSVLNPFSDFLKDGYLHEVRNPSTSGAFESWVQATSPEVYNDLRSDLKGTAHLRGLEELAYQLGKKYYRSENKKQAQDSNGNPLSVKRVEYEFMAPNDIYSKTPFSVEYPPNNRGIVRGSTYWIIETNPEGTGLETPVMRSPAWFKRPSKNNSLVISAQLRAYPIRDGRPDLNEPLSPGYITAFLVIPSAKDLKDAGSEEKAGLLARKNCYLWLGPIVPGSDSRPNDDRKDDNRRRDDYHKKDSNRRDTQEAPRKSNSWKSSLFD